MSGGNGTGAPLRISWSQIRAWDECNMKVMLQRSGKRNPAQNIRGFFHGTVADRVMREWLETPELRPGHMAEMVDEITDREEQAAIDTEDGVVRYKNAGDKVEMLAWIKELVTRLEPLLQTYVLPYDYEPARRFRAPVEIPGLDGKPRVVLLSGEMDLLVRDTPRDQWAVWDLKATADDQYWRKTVNQLVFYDIATWLLMGKPTTITGLIQPMCKQPVVPLKVTQDQRAAMMQRITAFAHGIWRVEASHGVIEMPETNSPCFWCAVKHACPRWAPRGDLRARLTGGGDVPTLDSLAGLSIAPATT